MPSDNWDRLKYENEDTELSLQQALMSLSNFNASDSTKWASGYRFAGRLQTLGSFVADRVVVGGQEAELRWASLASRQWVGVQETGGQPSSEQAMDRGSGAPVL